LVHLNREWRTPAGSADQWPEYGKAEQRNRPGIIRIGEETFRLLVNAGSVRKVTIHPAPWNDEKY